MHISIPPVIIGVFIIVVINFILSFIESNIIKKISILISSILSAVGIFGIVAIRPMLILNLNKNMKNDRLDLKFVTWATEKFDVFAITSIIVTSLVIIILVYLLLTYKKNCNCTAFYTVPWIVNGFRVIIFIATICYSYGTINKLFDLASYLLILLFCEIFVLYIPLIIKKIIMLKRCT